MVSSCDGQALASSASTSYTHEQVGSYCASSPAFGTDGGFELAEKEWAQSEVGESVEEVWERAVSTICLGLIGKMADCAVGELGQIHINPASALFDWLQDWRRGVWMVIRVIGTSAYVARCHCSSRRFTVCTDHYRLRSVYPKRMSVHLVAEIKS